MLNFIKRHAKIYMILSICVLIGAIGVSYAYYAASVTNDTVVVGQAGGGELPLLTISKVSTQADDKLVPITMNEVTLTKAASASPKCVDNRGYTGCQIYSVTVTNNSNVSQSYSVNLTSLYGENTPNIEAVTMGNSNSEVTNASSIKDNGLICTTNSVGNGESTTPCYFMVLIKNIDSAQTDSGVFNGTVTITSTAGAKLKASFGKKEKLTTTISNLYNNAAKTSITAEDGITYNYASNVSLMNDRLGLSSVGLDDGNIRYYGATPNNYIDIGDVFDQDIEVKNWIEPMQQFGIPSTYIPSTTSSCMEFMQCSNLVGLVFNDTLTCEAQIPSMLESIGYSNVNEFCSTSITPAGTTKALYRIIGLFKDVELADGTKKDLIKVMRNEPIGPLLYDRSPDNINNGKGINEWSQADLMKLLNPDYEEETVNGSLYWNSGSGNCYAFVANEESNSIEETIVPCDFTKTGLSKNVQSIIPIVKWNLGGWNDDSIFASQIYNYERGTNVIQNPTDGIERTTIWPGRVALFYPSDYGYAVDLNKCKSKLDRYAYCTTYGNWMESLSPQSWTLTPTSNSQINVWNAQGSVYDWNNNGFNQATPVFYLDAEQTIEFGTGKSDDPYILS